MLGYPHLWKPPYRVHIQMGVPLKWLVWKSENVTWMTGGPPHCWTPEKMDLHSPWNFYAIFIPRSHDVPVCSRACDGHDRHWWDIPAWAMVVESQNCGKRTGGDITHKNIQQQENQLWYGDKKYWNGMYAHICKYCVHNQQCEFWVCLKLWVHPFTAVLHRFTVERVNQIGNYMAKQCKPPLLHCSGNRNGATFRQNFCMVGKSPNKSYGGFASWVLSHDLQVDLGDLVPPWRLDRPLS